VLRSCRGVMCQARSGSTAQEAARFNHNMLRARAEPFLGRLCADERSMVQVRVLFIYYRTVVHQPCAVAALYMHALVVMPRLLPQRQTAVATLWRIMSTCLGMQ
jgi:hypothetical protein